MLPHIQGCSRLYVAPDAELFLFPFEALPNTDRQETGDRYLLEDYGFIYLNTGRDLLRFTARQTTGKKRNTAVIISDPALRMAAPDRARKTAQWLKAHAGDTRPATLAAGHALSDTVAAPDSELTTLGASGEHKTLGEILATLRQIDGAASFSRTILDSLRQSDKYDAVDLYEQEEALELRVQSLESPRVLQLLAHGVFLPVEEEEKEGPAALFIEGFSQRQIQNPLLRSMLALTGASGTSSGNL